jgi:diguanylate cyclase (GGDEF)-like protein
MDTSPADPYAAMLTRFMATGPIGLLTLAPDGTVMHANEVAAQILEQDVTGLQFFDLVHPDDVARVAAAGQAHATNTFPKRSNGSVWRMLLPNGGSIEILVHPALAKDDEGVWYGQLGFLPAPPRLAVLETLELVAAGRPLAETLDRLMGGLATDDSGTAINWLDLDGTVHVFGNLEPTLGGVDPTGARDTDPTTPWFEAIAGDRVARVANLDDLPPHIADAARAAGYQACCVSPVGDPATGAPLLYINWVRHPTHLDYAQQTFADVLEDVLRVALVRAEDTRKLHHAAHYDQLTDLANRRAFFDELATAIGAGSVSVLYLDLDRFKPINDRLGHDAGDQVLVEIADRLRVATPRGSMVARLGGDEFAIVNAGDDGQLAERLAVELVEAIPRSIELVDHGPVSVSVSIGSAVTDATALDDPRALMAAADDALRRAKGSGKGAWVRAEPRVHTRSSLPS